jgi:hypothetical protein
MLYRIKDDKHYAVTGTKGFLWMESEMARDRGAKVNMAYFDRLAEEAVMTIGKFGDFDEFVS